jgi:Peptidase family M1 domain
MIIPDRKNFSNSLLIILKATVCQLRLHYHHSLNRLLIKSFYFLLFTFYFSLSSLSQKPYTQQQVNFTIDVTLNDKEHTLSGFEKIEYINNSPDTLTFIWFHLWPNAYKNDKTAFSDQLLENGNTKFYFSNKEQRGYINKLDFKVNNITAKSEDHPKYIDIIKLILPAPLAPGDKAFITTPFNVKLPYNFSRGGHYKQSYQATQWFPKPAVYDHKGWHPMPYLDQGEFYSEFGNFDVRITVPKNYIVAATGELQNEEELKMLKENKKYNNPNERPAAFGQFRKKINTDSFPPSSNELKTLQYKQNNVHDFAWFADKRFIINYDTLKLQSGKTIDVFTYYLPSQSSVWAESILYSKKSIQHYSKLVGEYPYNIVSAVQGPQSFGGGMEYPTITVISPTNDRKELEYTIVHEIGHNWFYGILANNERNYPWMDEGINTFYEKLYITGQSHHYDVNAGLKKFEMKAADGTDQPINLSSEEFTPDNYSLSVYEKTAAWMALLSKQLGPEIFNKAMQDYYNRWQFKHPYPEDFKKSLEISTGRNLDNIFNLLNKTGPLPNKIKSRTEISTPVSWIDFGKEKAKNTITILPVPGINSYDKFMIGGLFTNYRLIKNKFQFLLLPMYATGSKQLAGLGKLNYTFYSSGIFRKADVFLNASHFTVDDFKKDDGKKLFQLFTKVVPGIRLTLKEKNPRSTLERFVQWKTFLINEDGLRFSRDTVITGADTVITNNVRKKNESRTLNQLVLVAQNRRALYPYKAELKIEQGKGFVRTAFNGNYFFNYAKEGGLDVRLFAGNFFYTGAKTTAKQFETDRYHLNMTGANGYEDYTYSDYFIGRNEFEKMPSQQIMVRDGGFKVRTDLLASKVGKTDGWLMAANFATTIPSGLNPLSVLPFKIPLKFFTDIGTYSDVWKKDAEGDRFLFDAGIQVSLLKETIHIYLPFIYSAVYKNYIQSTIEKKGRLAKTISFSIDISNLDFKKFNRNISF